MVTNRTPLQRERFAFHVSDEMVSLFSRGLELVAQGHDDVDDDSTEAAEYRALDKRLCWELIGVLSISVFDRELHQSPPSYMDSAMRQDWATMQAWRKALDKALEARKAQ